IIDEALSVGDKAFSEKSLDKMKEFKSQGKTMIFVSHSIGQMKKFCEKILWLEFGKVKEFGSVEEVMPKYEAFLKRWKEMTKKEREAYRDGVFIDEEVPSTEDDDLVLEFDHKYTEQLASRMGRIRAGESYIYPKPNELKGRVSSKGYRSSTYYIKRRAVYNNELFYLLSDLPSGEDGVIGWIKASKVTSPRNLAIDNDSKTFYINGEGSGYNRPWGGKKDCVYPDLKKYKNMKFIVDKTEIVGKGVWYRGMLNGEHIWIHSDYLESSNEESVKQG